MTNNKEIISELGFFDKLRAAIAADPNSADPTKSYQSQLMAIQQNRQVGAMADMLYNAWSSRYLQLMRANSNQPLDDKNYIAELTAFIETNLLPTNTKILQMNNSAQLRKAISDVAATRNNKDLLKTSFEKVIDLAAVARATKTAPVRRSSNQGAPSTAAATPQAQQQMQNAINQLLSGQQQKTLSQLVSTNPGGAVRSTGDAQLDAFLTVLGFRVS